jgi:hypothetical protein
VVNPDDFTALLNKPCQEKGYVSGATTNIKDSHPLLYTCFNEETCCEINLDDWHLKILDMCGMEAE